MLFGGREIAMREEFVLFPRRETRIGRRRRHLTHSSFPLSSFILISDGRNINLWCSFREKREGKRGEFGSWALISYRLASRDENTVGFGITVRLASL